jgi:hypothetical protein
MIEKLQWDLQDNGDIKDFVAGVSEKKNGYLEVNNAVVMG